LDNHPKFSHYRADKSNKNGADNLGNPCQGLYGGTRAPCSELLATHSLGKALIFCRHGQCWLHHQEFGSGLGGFFGPSEGLLQFLQSQALSKHSV